MMTYRSPTSSKVWIRFSINQKHSTARIFSSSQGPGPGQGQQQSHFITPHHAKRRRYFSTTDGYQNQNNKIRVAIVGGGVSGLSTALHLAPLVERGLIAKPIDLYERSPLEQVHPHEEQQEEMKEGINSLLQSKKSNRHNDENFHPGTGSTGRDIGVGIWSSALEPFLRSHPSSHDDDGEKQQQPRESHINLIQEMIHYGEWIGEAGYRTPSGNWLTRSILDSKGFEEQLSKAISSKSKSNNNSTSLSSSPSSESSLSPALLFLREKDFLSSLKNAVHQEENNGNIHTHYAGKKKSNNNNNDDDDDDNDGSTTVDGISLPKSENQFTSGHLQFNDGSTSQSSYNLIIAADGINSTLRSKYKDNAMLEQQIEQRRRKGGGTTAATATTHNNNNDDNITTTDTNDIEERGYTVFRGNALLSHEQSKMNQVSFQTWGEEKSMRFAAVPLSHPSDNGSGGRNEKQVWFATISDCKDLLSSAKDSEARKRQLIKYFNDWHDPIKQLIESTPADSILMERAIAHKYSVNPVFNTNEVLQAQDQLENGICDLESNNHNLDLGPTLLFLGDANMTVDPVLAQGFTIAMEGGADLALALELSLEKVFSHHQSSLSTSSTPSMVKAEEQMRNAIQIWSEQRYGRRLCLLRASDLVQVLAQPSTGSMTGFLSKNFLRPMIQWTPQFVKEKIFHHTMEYSLGYHGKYKITDVMKSDNDDGGSESVVSKKL